MNHWSRIEADRAFTAATRGRRRAALVGRLLGRGCAACGLRIIDEGTRRPAGARGVREIRLEAISGTVEPNRAADFDHEFRPAGATRCRWQRVWLAFRDGVALPPISVVQVGDAYAIRDGHHRVSVAKALGAPTIHAIVA